MTRERAVVTLADVVDINPARPLERGRESAFVAMEDLAENERQIRLRKSRAYPGSGSRFRNGDTLLARITPCLENGKTAFVEGILEPGIGYGSTEFIVLAARDEVTDPLFVYYLARSPKFRAYAIAEMTGSSGRQRVPTNAVARFSVSLPPLQEQRAIAGILGAFDDKIELNRRMNETLDAIARELFKSWFIDFAPVRAKAAGRPSGLPPHLDALFPDHFEESDLGEIPAGWRVGTIGDAVAVNGGSTPRTNVEEYWDGQFSWATPKDMSSLRAPVLQGTSRSITASGLAQISSGLLPQGTVLLSSRAPIGYLAIADTPVAVNQGIVAMVCRQPVSPAWALNWTIFNMDAIKGRAGGTTFAEISKSNFRSLPAVLAPDAVQAAFSSVATPLYERVASNERQCSALAALRDLLLPELLSGRVTASGT